MKRLLLSVAACGALSLGAHGQSGPADARHATVLDLTGATGPTQNYASAAAWRLWGLDAGGRFQVGLGLRASHYFAGSSLLDNQTTAGGAGIQVWDPRLTALNAAFHVRARVAGPVRLGFNLDVLGASFGPARSLEAPGLGAGAQAQVSPVRGNLLLGGTRDRGSLNSEFYAAVALPQGLSLRVGWSHIVTAYATDADRYRRFRNLAALGVSYQLP